jgi:hypothetical protein
MRKIWLTHSLLMPTTSTKRASEAAANLLNPTFYWLEALLLVCIGVKDGGIGEAEAGEAVAGEVVAGEAVELGFANFLIELAVLSVSQKAILQARLHRETSFKGAPSILPKRKFRSITSFLRQWWQSLDATGVSVI